ncbi:hypothetical protein K439DRAFT_1069414 [Ramaria rubella]|nr:hypothetical protein K439DRAFT_1069414 [Ramaria rubella]
MSMLPRFLERVTGYPGIPVSTDLVEFTSMERKGVIVMAVAGVTSCSLISLLLLYIIASALSARSQPAHERPELFITKQIAVFLTCLLLSDLIQSIAGIIQVKWAVENRIYQSRTCTIQGATFVLGDLGSTLWSVVIAAHTFSGITMKTHWPRWVMWVLVCTGWILVVILTFIIPLGLSRANKDPYFAIAGTWCFISSNYAVARLVIHYIPIYIAALTILILYLLIFLFLRGSIHFLPAEGPSFGLDDDHSRHRLAIAKRMLWYPVAYLTCVFPIAVIRTLGFHVHYIPALAWIISESCLFCLGGVDAVIYATTRTVIKPIHFSFCMRSFGNGSDATSDGPMVVLEQVLAHDKRLTGESNVEHRHEMTREGSVGEMIPATPEELLEEVV